MSEQVQDAGSLKKNTNESLATVASPAAPSSNGQNQYEAEQALREQHEEAATLEELGRLRMEIEDHRSWLSGRQYSRSIKLAVLLPGLSALMVFLFFLSSFVYKYIPYPFDRFPPFLFTWAAVLVISLPAYYFFLEAPLRATKNTLSRLEEELLNKQLRTSRGRRLFFQDELRRLTNASAKVFFEDEDRYEQAARWRKRAGEFLEKKVVDLNEIQFSLNSLNEIILLEKKEKWEQRVWQYIAVVIMLVYIVALIASVLFTNAALSNSPTPIFGIPLSIVMWGAAGSLAAILYRFYTEKGRVRLAKEVRWLIARPIIGIIMGAVVYLALISGLVLLGASPNTADKATAVAAPVGRIEVYWVVAFLAGFSDKFYIGIIDLLVARAVNIREDSDDAPPASLVPPNKKRARSTPSRN